MDIKKILSEMSTEEKVSLLSGKSFWTTRSFERYGIPSLFMSDGPGGLRKQNEVMDTGDMLGVHAAAEATCYPAAVTLANSWDPSAAEKVGAAIASEALEQHVGMVLGPGNNIKRNPLGGRSFEYYSEDPVLSGEMSAGYIRGMEDKGISSCLKHFALNSQESGRFNSNGSISERALREIYLRPFEIAVKKGRPSAVMSAYPMINGEYCSDNKRLLTDILRDEWGFDGMVVTDWGGMNDRISAVSAGCDLMMPGGSDYMQKELVAAVKNGTLPVDALDRCCERIISLALKEKEVLSEEHAADHAACHRTAVDAAVAGAVLLKNDADTLPLSGDRRIGIVGYMAGNIRYQGSGSSHVNPRGLVQPLDIFRYEGYAQGCGADGDTNEELLREVRELAGRVDDLIVFAGLPDTYESEGFDRTDMRMPEGHVKMIMAACGSSARVIVVLLCGSAVECPWADSADAILYMGLGGEGCAEAAEKIIYGEEEPSGRLSQSWPYKCGDDPSSDTYAKTCDAFYTEDIFVGYRYYLTSGTAVRYPFGYGLGYTEFDFEKIVTDGTDVRVTVRNAGNRPGNEVVQLYIGKKDFNIYRPIRELKAFRKLRLGPGETGEVTFSLTDRDFSVWHGGKWRTDEGTYVISVGKSCEDILLETEIYVPGEKLAAEPWQKGSWYERPSGRPPKADWDNLMGRCCVPKVPRKGRFTLNNSVAEMKGQSLMMRLVYLSGRQYLAMKYGGMKKAARDPEYRMLLISILEISLRGIAISGGLKTSLAQAVLDIANGRIIRGLSGLLRR